MPDLQGEFAVRLRQLEKALLAALNESKVRENHWLVISGLNST